MIVHIFGGAGSGTSTLGRAIAAEYGCFFMDTDDYFWMPTDPPQTTISGCPPTRPFGKNVPGRNGWH